MNIPSRIAAISGFLLAFVSPADPKPAPKGPDAVRANLLTPPACFRTRLTIGDDDRTWTYLHSYAGGLDLTWTLGTVSGQAWPGSAVEEWYDSSIHGGWTLPEGLKPGKYQLDTGAGSVALEVVAAPVRKKATIPAGDSLKAVRKALNQGFLDITLEPGEHVWGEMLALPGNCILRGYGATVRRAFVVNVGTNWPAIYVGGQDISVYGVTFVYDRPGQVFYANPVVSGLVVADCTFKRCNFGFYMTGALIRDCTFDGGGAVIAPGGLWLRCKFNGPSMQHAWSYWSGMGPVFMLDPVFTNTDRANVFNAAGGPIEDFLCVGLCCRGIDRTPNGNEIGLVEGAGAFRRATYLHTRISGCQSAFLQIASVGTDIFCRDFAMSDGAGICLWWGAYENVTFQDFELRNGAGAYFGTGTKNCQMIDGSVISWAPGRGGQVWQNPSPLGYLRKIAVWNEGGPTNTLTRVPILGLPSGFTAQQGFVTPPVP